MSNILSHLEKTCEYCGDSYYLDESDAWNPACYCSGECEILDEEEDAQEHSFDFDQ